MIKWFDEVQDTDFNLVGGKGYNLSKMKRYGLRIPNGFIITSQAYDRFVSGTEVGKTIENIIAKEISTKAKSDLIKGLFKVQLIDSELINGIMAEFAKIPSQRVAVRSSSTVEDLPGMSFAGQYTTYLNVRKADLIEKVALCWASLWNERAIEYREKHRVEEKFSHSVVVQEMINSKVAGVIFTANPINGVRNEVFVNASYGLGEAIVGGNVNPDQYVLNKSDGSVLEKTINAKETMCVYSNDGIAFVDVADNMKNSESLEGRHLKDIVEESKKIEEYFDFPQDIEFAVDEEDTLYILQSREITSLFPLGEFIQDDKLRGYMCFNTVAQGIREPFTPMGQEIWKLILSAYVRILADRREDKDIHYIKSAAGRVFIDMTYILSRKMIRKGLGKQFGQKDLPFTDTFNVLLDKHGQQLLKQGIKFKIPFAVYKYFMNMVKSVKKLNKTPEESLNGAKLMGETVIAAYAKEMKLLKTTEQKLDFIDRLSLEMFETPMKQVMFAAGLKNLGKVQKMMDKMFDEKVDLEPITKSLPGNVTTEMGMALNHLAQYFDEQGLQPADDHEKVKEFIEIYGHRSSIELDVGIPRWSEDSKYIIDMIRSFMVDKMYKRNIEDFEAKRVMAEQVIEEVCNKVRKERGNKKADKIRALLNGYRLTAGIREYPKFDIVRMMAMAREVLMGMGDELVAEGLIDSKSDVFYLYIRDILDKRDLKGKVAFNKSEYKKEMTRVSIPRIVLNTGETFYTARRIEPGAKVMEGMAVSPGIYEGVVRVVLDPTKSELKEGEILVTESTNPAWTPLFISAKALIMESGGPVSHGAIVAREYGIPAIVGIPNVTEVLKTGQRVRVNGETGVVELLD